MAPKADYKIVSNADIVIVLRNPATHFAVWEKLAIESEPPPPPPPDDSEEDALEYPAVEPEPEPLLVNERAPTMDPSPEEVWDRGEGFDFSFQAFTASVIEPEGSGNDAGPSDDVEPEIEKKPVEESVEEPVKEPFEKEEIHFHVCSGNLMTAVPYFNRMLQKDGWEESKRNEEDGFFHLSAEEMDEEAFVLLMNIFHLRNSKVPRTVTLEMLAKVAVLVDYYDCGEAISLFTGIWIPDLQSKEPVPTSYCRNLILWIWVSWVFRLSGPFEQATAIAIDQSTESMRDLGLPIPAWITEKINLARLRTIESVISNLYRLLDNYRSTNYECPYSDEYSFECGSMLLGALMKGMDSANVLSPRPEVPFADESYESIRGKISSMKSPTWSPFTYRMHPCTLEHVVSGVAIHTEGLSVFT